MNKSRQRFWELAGSKLGDILGVQKTAEQVDADTAVVGELGEVDFKEEAKLSQHLKEKGEAVSDFAKSKSLSQMRQYLPIYSVREELLQLVKQDILPRVHGLALRTTVAAVRVNALRFLGDLVPSLDKQGVLDVLQTLQRCTAVDHSAPTLMCTLGVSQAIYKPFGLEFTAEHVLTQVFPLLIVQQLNIQQFAKYMLFVKDILRKIEEKRGMTLTEYGTSEARISPTVSNELHYEPYQKQRGPVLTAKKTASWDEDWSLTNRRNAPASNPLSSNLTAEHSASQAIPLQSSTFVVNQQTTSIPPGDILIFMTGQEEIEASSDKIQLDVHLFNEIFQQAYTKITSREAEDGMVDDLEKHPYVCAALEQLEERMRNTYSFIKDEKIDMVIGDAWEEPPLLHHVCRQITPEAAIGAVGHQLSTPTAIT